MRVWENVEAGSSSPLVTTGERSGGGTPMHSEHEQARAGHSESEDLPLTELKCRDTVEGDTDMEATEAVIGPTDTERQRARHWASR